MIDAIIARFVAPMPPAVALVCVCGHTHAEHRETVLSVPLRGRGHYRPVTTIPGNTVTETRPHASYTGVECHCGCREWLPDMGT